MARILVIDDSMFSRNQICKILVKGGHETFVAEDGLKGLDKVKEVVPHCILTDLLMPELDGVGFLKELHGQGSRIPVIVVTADVQDGTRSVCMDLGAAELLNKPLREEQLLETIKRLVADEV